MGGNHHRRSRALEGHLAIERCWLPGSYTSKSMLYSISKEISWVVVKELSSTYDIGESILITIYTYGAYHIRETIEQQPRRGGRRGGERRYGLLYPALS